MSTQKFTDEQRYAIWEAHDKKCFYRGGLLTPNQVVIDHLVPESTGDLPPHQKTQVFKGLGLEDDYDVRAYYNLVPACGQCNGRKAARKLDHRHIGLDLAITRPLAEPIEKKVASLVAGRSLAQALQIVQSSVSAKKFTPKELLQALQKQYGTGADELLRTADAARFAATDTTLTRATRLITFPPSIRFANERVATDQIRLLGAADMLQAIADERAHGEVLTTADGSQVYVLRADDLYIKYMRKGETLMLLSCHL